MHTSIILKEALNKLTKRDGLELAIVLLAIVLERLMKQHLYEIDSVLILDKNNDTHHIIKFRKLRSKIQKDSFKQKLEALDNKRENFKTITFDKLVERYDAFFDLSDDRKLALKRLANLRNNIVHYFSYYIDEVEEGLFILNEIIPFIRELIQEISDSEKYDELFDEETVSELQELEEKLTKLKLDELRDKIKTCRKYYYEMNEEEIESKKQESIRDYYEEREILKEDLQCPACENYTFHVLKLFIGNSEDENIEEFSIKGKCLVCELELTESELKDLNFLDGDI